MGRLLIKHIELKLYFDWSKSRLIKLNKGGRIDSTFCFREKVSHVELDPRLLLIDLQVENSERVRSEANPFRDECRLSLIWD